MNMTILCNPIPRTRQQFPFLSFYLVKGLLNKYKSFSSSYHRGLWPCTLLGFWVTISPEMTTHKLKLKRTPEEKEQHRLRKERRREKKRKRESDGTQAGSSSKRVHGDDPSRKWASSDEDEMEYGPQPAGSSSHIPQDYDALKAEIEERIFREKMFDALGDDERLDSVEARFNDFAQVPERWRTSSSPRMGAGTKGQARAYDDDELLKLDPQYMDEEEYVEWIRAGMYRFVFLAILLRIGFDLRIIGRHMQRSMPSNSGKKQRRPHVVQRRKRVKLKLPGWNKWPKRNDGEKRESVSRDGWIMPVRSTTRVGWL